jgi:hypothetical protein
MTINDELLRPMVSYLCRIGSPLLAVWRCYLYSSSTGAGRERRALLLSASLLFCLLILYFNCASLVGLKMQGLKIDL